MADDEAIAAHALARGFLTAAQLADARRRLALLRTAGVPGDLLAVLEPGLRPQHLLELRALGRPSERPAAGGATVAPAAGGATVSPRYEEAPRRPTGRASLPSAFVAPGDHVGPYRIVRELGRGGMGAVYVAEHAELGRAVALKLRLPGGVDPRGALRFVREAQAAASLRHPGVVAVHDSGTDERGRMWLAMDLVDGESLDHRLARDGALPSEEVARIGIEVARALEHAHAQGVLHRDMKPANVIVRRSDGAALVTDFGLAKVVEGAESLTKTGELMGTPTYMPPEQAGGRVVDARADVWSLGATLYHLATGRPPFEGAGVVGTLAAVIKGDVEPPRAVRPDVPAALEAVILRCLEKDLRRRYPDVGALALDLERIARGETTEALAARRVESRRRVGLVAGGGCAGVVAIALAIALADRVVETLRPAPPAVVVAPPAPPTPSPPPEPEPEPEPEPDPEPPDPVPPPTPIAAKEGVWIRPPVDRPPPPPRQGHAAAWDGRRELVVIHGGFHKAEVRDDAWSWDGVGWTRETGEVPDARFGHVMAYDPVRQVLVVHGGSSSTEDYIDPLPDGVWERDRSGWKHIPARGPGPRSWHAMVWSPSLRRVVLFGGRVTRTETVADLWAWDGKRWEALRPGPAPTPTGRSHLGMAWDEQRDALLVLGASSGVEASELCEWSPRTGWSTRPLGPLAPRGGMAVAMTPVGLVVFGGLSSGKTRQDTWALSGAEWRQLSLDVPPGDLLPGVRRGHSLVWDPVRGCLVLFAGDHGKRAGRQDTWTLRPPG